jgi:chitin disaccharide deacetylase
MKYLIVNADDFGASRGINRGILEAHQHGILTSTSLMVNALAAEEAVALSRTTPNLSLGLHADLQHELKILGGDLDRRVLQALRAQWARFQDLTGRRPTHLDSHHNVHRDPQLLPHFLCLAEEFGLPMREHSPVRYFSRFYGQWGGETHLEQISVESLTRMLATEIQEGLTELSCHPGYAESDYPGSYVAEREPELRTLCDPRVRQALAEQSIQLISYHDFARLPRTASI